MYKFAQGISVLLYIRRELFYIVWYEEMLNHIICFRIVFHSLILVASFGTLIWQIYENKPLSLRYQGSLTTKPI